MRTRLQVFHSLTSRDRHRGFSDAESGDPLVPSRRTGRARRGQTRGGSHAVRHIFRAIERRQVLERSWEARETRSRGARQRRYVRRARRRAGKSKVTLTPFVDGWPIPDRINPSGRRRPIQLFQGRCSVQAEAIAILPPTTLWGYTADPAYLRGATGPAHRGARMNKLTKKKTAHMFPIDNTLHGDGRDRRRSDGRSPARTQGAAGE